MTDHVLDPVETEASPSVEDRLRTMHTTLLFMAVLLCVLVALNVVVIAAG
jgi:hypothetical protein